MPMGDKIEGGVAHLWQPKAIKYCFIQIINFMITANTKRIVIADDHVSVREGLMQMIDGAKPLQVIAAVDNGKRLLEAVAQFEPDLVITDIRMPEMGGLAAAAVIRATFPRTALMGYVSDESDFLFMNMLEAGFDGIVLKRASKQDTILAIQVILSGHDSFCHASQERVNRLVRKGFFNPKRGTVRPFFTDREISVLQGICAGLTSKKIAEQIFLSERTIESHRGKSFAKNRGTQYSGAGELRFYHWYPIPWPAAQS